MLFPTASLSSGLAIDFIAPIIVFLEDEADDVEPEELEGVYTITF